MDNHATLISVVIPVYNGERHLAAAIESALAQTYPGIEVIVVDDGSTDSSASIAMRFGERVTLVTQHRGGAGPARNHGVDRARGDLLAFLDADDLWLPNKTKLQMSKLIANPNVEAAFGLVEQFISPELPLNVASRIKCPEGVQPGYIPGTLLIRQASWRRIGPFSPGFRLGEFIEWYARAEEAGLRSVMLPDVVLSRRLHDANSGITERDSRADYVRILKATMDRRRRQVVPRDENGPTGTDQEEPAR
ncbi:MAG: glycosyltransferase family A protein [Acidobacteriota bacterium]